MSNPTYPGTGISTLEREAFERDGYIVLDHAFGSDDIRSLRDAADRAERRWLEDSNRQGSDQPFLRRVEPLIEYGDEFVEVLDDPRFFPIIRELLGNSVAILDTAYFITPSGQGRGDTSDWHLDEALTGPLGAPIPLMVKASIPLDDVTDVDDGPTTVIPGSHARSFNDNQPAPEDPRHMPGHVPLLASAGDVYIFHGRIYHAALPNVGTRTRRMLQYNYGHIWMKPWPGHEPSERLRRSANTAVRRQLLHISDHPYQARLS